MGGDPVACTTLNDLDRLTADRRRTYGAAVEGEVVTLTTEVKTEGEESR